MAKDIEVGEASFETILSNLLENALKYSQQGKIEVAFGIQEDGDRTLILEVSDQGIGIPPDEREDVFEYMYRGKGKEIQRQEGVGLGLYLLKRQIEYWGGYIHIDNERKVGTKFEIFIPYNEQIRPWRQRN